jgi:hypothetical protein
MRGKQGNLASFRSPERKNLHVPWKFFTTFSLPQAAGGDRGGEPPTPKLLARTSGGYRNSYHVMQPGMGARPSNLRIVFRTVPFPFGALNLEFCIDCKNIKCTIVN